MLECRVFASPEFSSHFEMESTLEIASLDPRALSELIKKHVEAFGIKMPPEFFNEEFGELV